MTNTPAGHLARLKAAHGERWRIDYWPAAEDGTAAEVYQARERDGERRILTAGDVPTLDALLFDAEDRVPNRRPPPA